MAIVLKDRVKQTASNPGTGTITLLTTPTGFQAFSAIGNGNVTYFAIVDSASGAWEVNYGTYTSSGTTLSRNATPLSSSNAGALVNFTGTVDVFCTYPSSKAIYEETTGNVLIDGGPITVIGNNVTSYTTFSAALGELYANINSFAQLYAQNLSNGASASADFVAYNNLGNGTNNFVDMGINSSNYSDPAYPIFTAGSAYTFNDGGEMFVGSATDDLILFAGGVATTNWALRANKTTQALTTKAGLTLGGALTGIGGSFTSPVTTTSSMTAPGTTEFVTKGYVDSATSSALTFHTAVQAATTQSLAAQTGGTVTYNNGASGVGATITLSVALTVLDGYTLANTNRILVKNESNQTYNGVYTWATGGTVLTRATDADTAGSGANLLSLNDYFYVQNGTVNKGVAYVLSSPSTAIVFGTSNIQFAEFSSAQIYTGTSPVNVTGTVISVSTIPATSGGTGTATVTTGDLLYGSATNTWGKLPKGGAYRALVMDGSATNVEWNAIALNQTNAVSGTLAATNGGTGLNAYTLGDTIYSSAANTLLALAGNTTTTKKFLTQTGTGAASAAPAWGTISGSDVSGNISGSAGSVANALTLGTYLTGTSFNGSAAVTATVDATSANTASKVVARDSSGNFSAGTITATLSGAATSATTATNIAGGLANQIHYQSSAGVTAFATAPSASGTVLNWNGSAFTWVNGTISGVALGSNLSTLTLATSGTGLSGSTTYNGSAAATFTVTSNATNANTVSTIVARDASGNFSAGTITATLSGNATNVSGTVAIANGGSGTTTAQGAMNAFAGAVTSGSYLRGNGTNVVMSTIQAADVPTLNQNTTGSSGSCTGNAATATTATTATTANATNTANNFQMNSLGVGTAGSGTAGEIRATNNVTAYYSSDIKFKENVRDIPNAAATAAAIGGKLFDWKDSYIEEHGGEDGYFVVKADFGVIAQDVLAKFPVAVRTRPDGSLAVDYEKLSALALAANAEHEERIAKLEALVAQLIKG